MPPLIAWGTYVGDASKPELCYSSVRIDNKHWTKPRYREACQLDRKGTLYRKGGNGT